VSGSGAYTGEVAFTQSPDRRSLVAVDETGRLDVWDLATGQVTKTIATKGRKVHQVIFTPDGRQLLVAAQEGPNTVWDLAAGKKVAEFTPPPKKDPKADEYWWNTLAFSPDGRLLAASKFGRGTWMWTWPNRDLLWHDAQELGCYFTPDGRNLITAGWYRDFEFRDPTTGTIRRTVSGSHVGVTDFAASPDGRRIAMSDVKGPFAVRDPATGAALREIRGATRTWSVAFSPSGWLLAVAGDKSVRIYDTASWQEVTRLDGHVGHVRSVYFGTDDATVVSASGEDGTALVWDLHPLATKNVPDTTRLWTDLAGDGAAAWRAIWSAAAHADAAIRLFREKWPPPKEPLDPKRVAALIADLDSARFAAREAAVAELTKLGRRAEGQIREAAKSGSAEARQRAEGIIITWSGPSTAEVPAEDAREMRAVWALELAGTPSARALLKEWADGRVGRRLWEEAEAATRRLAARR